jgi:peptide/nickel transport system ATP-binding protein
MSDAPPLLLDIRGLTVALPAGADRRHAVEDLSLRVHAGRTLCLVGESGSGKSLAASAIVRLMPSPQLRITGGQVLLDGRDTLSMDTAGLLAVRGGRIGYVFQDPLSCLNPLERVGRQVREVLDRHDWPGDRAARVQQLLADVGLPQPAQVVHKYPWQLSGGQRQRVMIAIALAADPALVIADEPTTALDVTTQAQILALLRELQARRGLGLLLITHDFGVVAEMADEVAVLKDGRLVEHGTREQVLGAPREPYTQRLLAAVPPLRPRAARAGGEPLLAAKGLRKTWAATGPWWRRGTPTLAVDGVELRVDRGETVAVVGESGSGKSTLARLLARLTEADGGSASLAGIADDYLRLPARELGPLRRAVQMVFQDPFASLNPRHTVGDSIAMGPIAAGTPRAQALREARELLERVRVDPRAADRYPHEFSGGQRQRIVIARALAMKARLLIADEPVSALDVSVQAEILDLFEEIQARDGVGMVFITHDLRVAARMADRILVMNRGQVVESGSAERVLSAPSHAYTRELLAAVPRMDGSAARPAASPPPPTDTRGA